MNTSALSSFRIGLDLGSTTAKMVVLDEQKQQVYISYRRHNTRILETICEMLMDISISLGANIPLRMAVTGSAGIGLSEKLNIAFIQEVVAATEVIKKHHPDVSTLVDIGGEDSKMIFFEQGKAPDIRMNGNCAGGTGAFIDQMASLLHIPLEEISELAGQSTQIYPIASRCGVFAKTDVQNLIARKISNADIMASVFQAVAIQAMNTLARGFDVKPKVMFIGGPFTFIPALKTSFMHVLHLAEEDVVTPDHPALIPATGAAYFAETSAVIMLDELIATIQSQTIEVENHTHRLPALFENDADFENWKQQRVAHVVAATSLPDYKGKHAFMGIDSGSTTTKIVLLGEDKTLLYQYYAANQANPVLAVKEGLQCLWKEMQNAHAAFSIGQCAVTGYGEDLIKAAFGMDAGMVETIAHYTAAQYLFPDVSFIMDIGGQDMKAIFVNNHAVGRIELNESCSSGCGSFIENFGSSLGFNVADFAEMACKAKAPCDLGTRCTVFMNSKVKQALRENATMEDISAGLAYSVIKNALFKVLKLKHVEELGAHLVVHGGTFKNPAIHRTLEILTDKKVSVCDIPELMGAYGAALTAMSYYEQGAQPSRFIGFQQLDKVTDYKSSVMTCKGCENNCAITKFMFCNGETFYSGNKCEKIFTNKGRLVEKGVNLFAVRNTLMFDRNVKPLIKISRRIKIGIPRALGMYENYPFWNTLFKCCGIEVVLSEPSTMDLYLKGMGTVMSDSICFPAKMMHGHVMDLVEKKVDRIFYPMVVFEQKEFEQAQNTYNCPIVSGYGDVIKSAVNPEQKYGIPVDAPTMNMANHLLLKKSCYDYVKMFGVTRLEFFRAFRKAVKEYQKYKDRLMKEAHKVIAHAQQSGRMLIVLAGRPYHADSLINHKTPEMLSDLGVDVIPDSLLPFDDLDKLQVVSQWAYSNRVYHAAQWVAKQPDNIQLVQFNSFGCGPDAIAVDECYDILHHNGKNHTLIKVDEITSTGSVKLRLRSMIESLQVDYNHQKQVKQRQTTAVFEEKDKDRTILAPFFAEIYAPFIPTLLQLGGYKCINLPKPDLASVEAGLRYANNEICYPATIVIGDIIKALQSENFNRDKIAIGITQTGGQCRASSYISLIKKAMVAAGFADIPVVSVNTDGLGKEEQPGFSIPWLKHIKVIFTAMLYADGIAKMYYASVVREKNKGDAERLRDKYLEKAQPYFAANKSKALLKLLKEAVHEFNQIEVHDKEYPRIGLVGEIYVKYNSFGHQYIVDWLIEQEIEVVVPPILDFFMQMFVNVDANNKSFLRKSGLGDFILDLFERLANHWIQKTDNILSAYKYHIQFHKIRKISDKAEQVVNLANQFGEGWLIPAEIAAFAEEGVNHVVSVQPFGCIANQVISKGVEKRLKDIYPNLNLLFLDFDGSASEVNIINRLHFMAKNVKN